MRQILGAVPFTLILKQIFLRYFKDSLNELVQTQFIDQSNRNTALPEDFLINHISSSFVEMILWWMKGHRKQSPVELDRYFRAVIEPVIKNEKGY